ncbi:MAG: glutathione S-transferase family protein [Bdellovibrionales bacterium]|nr:glutathione S-transferase family protein [Bdellovibrionales bacterium]
MYQLMGFATQNTMKVLYVLEELGVKYEFKMIDLMKGENKSPEFLKWTPVGKVPVLLHGDDSLFESGAICRYVANVENSPLYPENKLERAKVDQWMDFFSCHLGRWLSSLYYELVIKPKSGRGSTNQDNCTEARGFCQQQLAIVEKWLSSNSYLVGNSLTIADLFAFAYLEQHRSIDLSLKDYPHILNWYARIDQRESVKKARKILAL